MTIYVTVFDGHEKKFAVKRKSDTAKRILEAITASDAEFEVSLRDLNAYLGNTVRLHFGGRKIEGNLEFVGYSAQHNRPYVRVDGKRHYVLETTIATIIP